MSDTSKSNSSENAGHNISLEQLKVEIERLILEENYPEAMRMLHELSTKNLQSNTGLKEWIDKNLTGTKKKHDEILKNTQSLLHAAQAELKNFDYKQALDLLEHIPIPYRSPRIIQKIKKTIENEEEVRLLIEQLEISLEGNDIEGMEGNIERLLELKPNHKVARELWETMQTYQHLPTQKRNYVFNEIGQLVPYAENEDYLGKGMILGLTFCLLVIGLGVSLTYYFLLNRQALVKITRNTSDIELFIDGYEVIPRTGNSTNKLDPGKKILEIHYKEHVFKSAEFKLVPGVNPKLDINIENNRITAVFEPTILGSWVVNIQEPVVIGVQNKNPVIEKNNFTPSAIQNETAQVSSTANMTKEVNSEKTVEVQSIQTLPDGRKRVDLLKLIDLKRDGNTNLWEIENNKLRINTTENNKYIYAPLKLGNDYTVDCEFEIKGIPNVKGSHGMGFRTPIGNNRRVTVVIHDPQSLMLLNAVRGSPLQSPPYIKNVTRKPFELNRIHKVTYHVHYDESKLDFQGSFNGLPAFEYQGDVSIINEDPSSELTDPYGKNLVFTVWRTDRVIHSITITANEIEILKAN